MMKCPAAIDAPATPEYANGTYANGEANQERNCTKRPTNVPNNTPGPRNRPLSISFPRSHQRRYSADFCRSTHSPVIIVKKNLKEPDRPRCAVSLLTPQSVPRNPSKRYSCPPFAVFSTKTRPFASSSSSSSPPSSNSSSCSSPPPAVQTSAITGHDPLGWKLRPKSSSSSTSPRANRLSLQIPLPVIHHEIPASNSPLTPDPSTKTRPPLQPKPTQRRHSDSSALLKKSHPFVTLEELRDVHLAPVLARDESDDVFRDGGEEEEEEEVKATGKEPPPVPEKTVMARQIAQLMARSHQRKEIIYSRVIKTKRENSHETEDTSRMIVKKLVSTRENLL
ncbi:Bone morphogenetic protein 4 [Dissostichus eleginoides]|uniref:Bone morphogenetic protein 4 n=1 Tax=Dissostichus eleginoides TaxID=100907 RepID=A0AAD9BFI8_DISEL|nr:Bone morphogenetic protein 4 [Dissostichus eleginoides]